MILCIKIEISRNDFYLLYHCLLPDFVGWVTRVFGGGRPLWVPSFRAHPFQKSTFQTVAKRFIVLIYLNGS